MSGRVSVSGGGHTAWFAAPPRRAPCGFRSRRGGRYGWTNTRTGNGGKRANAAACGRPRLAFSSVLVPPHHPQRPWPPGGNPGWSRRLQARFPLLGPAMPHRRVLQLPVALALRALRRPPGRTGRADQVASRRLVLHDGVISTWSKRRNQRAPRTGRGEHERRRSAGPAGSPVACALLSRPRTSAQWRWSSPSRLPREQRSRR